jgi:hypothetical protein
MVSTPNSIDGYEQLHAELLARLAADGHSTALEADFRTLNAGAGLLVMFGPACAVTEPGEQMPSKPTEKDIELYWHMIDELRPALEQTFKHERWGEATVSFRVSPVDDALCPALRVRWANPMTWLGEYGRDKVRVTEEFESMIASANLLLSPAWSVWRPEVVDAEPASRGESAS